MPTATADQRIHFCAAPGGRRISYAIAGSGAAPPLVCPAFWVSHVESDWRNERYRRFFESLAPGRAIVRYDRAGAGLSDRPADGVAARDLETEVADLAAVIDAVGAPRVAMFAMSCAGPPAIAYAARHPDRVERLVLYGTYASGARIGRPEVRAAMLALVRAHWGLGSRALIDIFAPDVDADEARALTAAQKSAADAETAACLLELSHRLDVRGEVDAVRAPALVLHRRADRAIPFEHGRDLAASLPAAEFVPLDGAIHLPWLGDSGAIAEAARRFLGAGAPPEARGPKPEARDAALLRRGDVWEVRFGGRSALLKHAKGLADLAVLLARPGEGVHAADLAGRRSAAGAGDAAPEAVLDERARDEIRARLTDLADEIASASARGDEAAEERLSGEREALLHELRAATGLGGRPRTLGATADERARKAVTARVREAIAAIGAALPDLGAHLAATVRTGVHCSYSPDRAIDWRI